MNKKKFLPVPDGALKLDIGGGTQKRDEDYIAVDINGGDVAAPMWDIPYPDDSVDFIWSSHTLEHSGIYRVNQTLVEWLRLLKPGHQAIIQVPDFNYVAQYWLVGPDRPWAEEMVYGLQTNDGQFHKCAFTADSLKKDLESAGFEVVRVEFRWTHSQQTLQAVCRKPIKQATDE